MKPNKKAASGIAAGAPRMKFDQRLVLNQWLLDLFEVESFGKLTELLKSPELEGVAAENVSRFHYALAERVLERESLARERVCGEYANHLGIDPPLAPRGPGTAAVLCSNRSR